MQLNLSSCHRNAAAVLSLHDLQSSAYQIAKCSSIDHSFSKEYKLAGKDCMLPFIMQRCELSLRTPEATSFNGELLGLTECSLRNSSFR